MGLSLGTEKIAKVQPQAECIFTELRGLCVRKARLHFKPLAKLHGQRPARSSACLVSFQSEINTSETNKVAEPDF